MEGGGRMAPTCLPGANPWLERWFHDCVYE